MTFEFTSLEFEASQLLELAGILPQSLFDHSATLAEDILKSPAAESDFLPLVSSFEFWIQIRNCLKAHSTNQPDCKQPIHIAIKHSFSADLVGMMV